jgi:WD40 repeat protein
LGRSPKRDLLLLSAFAGQTYVRIDGARIVSADHSAAIRLWDVESGAVVLALDDDVKLPGMIMGIAYSPDGKCFATAGNQYVDVWAAATGKHIMRLPQHTWMTFCVGYSHDGLRIASGSRDGSVKVSNTVSGALINTLNERAGRTSALAFSPDDRSLAAASADGSIKVWDTTNWAAPDVIVAHNGSALCVAYSPDGRRLASGGADQTIKVWDRASGRELLSLRGHMGDVNAVAFNPDGKRLASAGGDHTIKIWDVSPGPPAAR